MGSTLILIFICRLVWKLFNWGSGKEGSEFVTVIFSKSFFGQTNCHPVAEIVRAGRAYENKFSVLSVKTACSTNSYFSNNKKILKNGSLLSVLTCPWGPDISGELCVGDSPIIILLLRETLSLWPNFRFSFLANRKAHTNVKSEKQTSKTLETWTSMANYHSIFPSFNFCWREFVQCQLREQAMSRG